MSLWTIFDTPGYKQVHYSPAFATAIPSAFHPFSIRVPPLSESSRTAVHYPGATDKLTE